MMDQANCTDPSGRAAPTRLRRRARAVLTSIAFAIAIVSTACGGSASDTPRTESDAGATGRLVASPTVSMTTIRGDSTQDISVWRPDTAEDLPVVHVLHGLSNDRDDMAGFATALAREGLVVFVPDIRTSLTSTAATDVECGYGFAMSKAAEFGGDIDQPVTLIGWSFGAVTALFSGLDEGATGLRRQAEGCALDTERPDVIVSIAGCFTTWDGDNQPIDPTAMGWNNTGASIVLVAGELDTACAPTESAEAVSPFEAAGYEVSYTEIAEAHHGAMVFYPPEQHGTIEQPTGRAGEQTVQLVLDAIRTAAE